ncbi:MAG: peptidoglycan DD-metalloendopeptidase family protein [Planctomycetota bacterium]
MLTSDYRPAHIDPTLWAELPAEVRLRLQRGAKRRAWAMRWTVRLLLLPPVAFIALPPIQGLLPTPGNLVRMTRPTETLESLDTTPIEEGDSVADRAFTITSGYGMRLHPTKGVYLPHNGVDVDTPTGTPLYAPALGNDTVTVSCWWDSNGGGTVAEITSTSVPDYRFKALHLSACKDGIYEAGQVIAETGDSGEGTGPHLDFRQLPIDSGVTIQPQKGYLEWLLTGRSGATAPETLRDSIKGEEGYSAEAYRDPGYGIPTIGFGATSYPDGSPVEMGDEISEEDAEALLDWHGPG